MACGPTGARLSLTHILQEDVEGLAVVFYDNYKDARYTGITTDYRHELQLATRYADDMMQKRDKPTLFTHSLLDSVAYASLKLERYMEHGAVSEYTQDKAILTFGVIGAMFKDTFKADEVLFLTMYRAEEGEAYVIQERVRMILEEFSIPYTDFDFFKETTERVANDVRKRVEKIING
jgi:hypothetical protein